MHFLFVRESLEWPRFSGSDVHCYYTMRALRKLGYDVSLATVLPPKDEATDGLDLVARAVLDDVSGETTSVPRLTRLQERFRSYWGLDLRRISAVGRFANQIGADVVVTVGLEVLPYLVGAPNCRRIWYAADEWVWHHLSMVRWHRKDAIEHLRNAIIKGLYERSYAEWIDRVWVVSEQDRRAMRWVSGVDSVDVVPNGVDTDYYRPMTVAPRKASCVFWGGLNYAPNIQALEWFCARVWPVLKSQRPEATFQVFGCDPLPRTMDLLRYKGVEIYPNLADLRAGVSANEIAVLPFVSGYGIKNKLLEAAGLGMASVCTTRACNGLRTSSRLPFVIAYRPTEWAAAILALWNDPARRHTLGTAAREWVKANHSWEAAAEDAISGLIRSMGHVGVPHRHESPITAGIGS
jgi:polysaccharide biosynthesis protein PslH